MRTNDDLPPRIRTLEGYVEIGMSKDALALAREILMDESANASEFYAALNAILIQTDNYARWKTLVMSAFRRLPREARKLLAIEMLGFLVSAEDYVAAQQYMPRTAHTVLDLFSMMPVLLANNRLKEARALARTGERLRTKKLDEFDSNMLLDALADCYARLGDWDKAAARWSEMHIDGAIGENGVRGLVKINVAQAILAAEDGLKKVNAFRKSSKGINDVTLPGNERKILDDLEKELKKIRRQLDAILPPHEQREFGIQTYATKMSRSSRDTSD